MKEKLPLDLRVKKHLLRSFIFSFYLLISLYSYSQVKGTVYMDFNVDGKQTIDAKYNELGVKGVAVKLFVGSNNTPFTTVTDSLGKYSFSAIQAPKDSMVRVEFADLPETFFGSFKGIQNGTTVQFGKASSTSVLDLGISDDQEFCKEGNNIRVVTACYVMGDPLKDGDAAVDPALVWFNYFSDGVGDSTNVFKLAYAKDIGSTWIASYQRASKRLLVGAMVRRHVGLGPLGTGGLYYVDHKNNNSVHEFIDVKKLGIDTGPDPHKDLITGLSILPASKLAKSRDSLAFHAAGKAGLGGVQLSRYQDTLYLINLYDKKLYSFLVKIPLVAPANATEAQLRSYTIPHPNCSNNEFAPWGLKYWRNKLYIGVVCTAETSQNRNDLKGAVYELSFKDFQIRETFQFPLGFRRDPIDGTPNCDTIQYWNPWTKVFPKSCIDSYNPAFLIYPQPILSEIEIDDDGSLLLGFMDRLGLQTGQNQIGIAPDDTLKSYYGFMSGDLLRAQRNADGTFTMESNGKSGPYTANGPSGPGVISAHDKEGGPGGGEFFYDDYWINPTNTVGHAELTNGGLYKAAGRREVFSTAFDPIHKVFLAAGFIAFDTQTGQRVRSFSIYNERQGTLGKSGGAGDLTGLCDPALLEIGNRVWFDANRNGIQDPNEKGIDNVIVELHDGATKVASDTTANGGQFYFNDFTVSGGLKRKHNYQIKLNMMQPLVAGKTIADSLALTVADATGNVDNNIRDSDALYNTDSSYVQINFTTGGAGENDHTLDIGLNQITVDVELEKYLVGSCKKEIGDDVEYKIVVKNASLNPASIADSVIVKDYIPVNLTYVSSSVTSGSFNPTTGLWGALTLSGGESDTLTLHFKVNGNNGFDGGIIMNVAEVYYMKGLDIDSKAGNNISVEDDYDKGDISVPFKICTEQQQTRLLVVPSGVYNTYQWYKNGVKIPGETSSTLLVHETGDYSVELDGVLCLNCCPFYVIDYCECPQLCTPVILKKIK